MRWILCAWLVALPGCLAGNIADASRGEQLLQNLHCLQCHPFDRYAPGGHLAKLLQKRLSASRLVGAMWSHVPTMWQAIDSAGVPFPEMSAREANDLLAWFAAAGYFEPPGDAKKGARYFREQLCSNCHSESGPGEGPPLSQWKSFSNPVDLFQSLWLHAPHMKAVMDLRKMPWPSLSTTEMRDILWYARTVADPTKRNPTLQIGDEATGKAIFELNQCQNCHKGRLVPEAMPHEHTLTELGAVLWNHAPMMMSLPPSLNREEMAGLVGFLWKSQYFDQVGNALRGKAVFIAKKCSVCHATVPDIGTYDAGRMLAALWKHSPAVLNQAQEKNISWPKFLDKEMEDLLAYANQARVPSLVK